MATAASEAKALKAAARGDGSKQGPLPRHPLLARVGDIGGGYRPAFPRRAFLAWRAGGGSYCDYIVEGEGVTEALQRLAELVGADAVDPATFQCEEKAGAAPARGRAAASASGGVLPCDASLLAALAALGLAMAYAGGYVHF